MAKKNEIEVLITATDNASKQFDNVSKKSQSLSDSLKNVKKYSWIATTALVWLWSVMVKQATDVEPVKMAELQKIRMIWLISWRLQGFMVSKWDKM